MQKDYKLNVFPNHKLITEKANLHNSLIEWCSDNDVDIDTIYPKTVVFDNTNTDELKKFKDSDIVIVKPSDSFGGQQIQVMYFRDFNINKIINNPRGIGAKQTEEKDNKRKWIIQEYLVNCKTIKNLHHNYSSKFDIRVNILLDYNGGMLQYNLYSLRVSDNEYKIPNFNSGELFDTLTHVTNLDLRDVRTQNSQRYMQDVVKDRQLSNNDIYAVDNFMNYIIRPFIIETVYKKYRDYTMPLEYDGRYDIKTNKQFKYDNIKCYQRFGIDLILLNDETVRLLEINSNPSNTYDNPDMLNMQFIGMGYIPITPNFTKFERLYQL
jgi:hypothetical protein